MTDVHLSKEAGLVERLEAVAQGVYWSDKALHEADAALGTLVYRIIAARRAIRLALAGERVDSVALSDAAVLLSALDGGRAPAALKGEEIDWNELTPQEQVSLIRQGYRPPALTIMSNAAYTELVERGAA